MSNTVVSAEAIFFDSFYPLSLVGERTIILPSVGSEITNTEIPRAMVTSELLQ
jgi:hypothetical protein